MKKRDSKPTADDLELLRTSLADVIPLPRANRAHTAPVPPRPEPVQRLRDEQAALAESLSPHVAWDSGHETGEELAYLRPGLPSLTLRKLRRGHWVIQDEIDLHGSTAAEAHALLSGFLADCLRRGLRCGSRGWSRTTPRGEGRAAASAPAVP